MASTAPSETRPASHRTRSPRRFTAEIERRVRKATDEFKDALKVLEDARSKMTSVIGTTPDTLTEAALPDETVIAKAAQQVVASYGSVRRHLGEQIERAVERRYRSAEDILQFIVSDVAFGDERLERVRVMMQQGASAQDVLRALTRDEPGSSDDAAPSKDAAA